MGQVPVKYKINEHSWDCSVLTSIGCWYKFENIDQQMLTWKEIVGTKVQSDKKIAVTAAIILCNLKRTKDG